MRMIIVVLALLTISTVAEAAVEPKYLTERDPKTGAKHRLKWGPASEGAQLTYHFVRETIEIEGFKSLSNCRTLRPFAEAFAKSSLTPHEIRRSAENAMARWTAAARLTFTEVSAPEKADILIGAMPAEDAGAAWTNYRFDLDRSDPTFRMRQATVCFSPNRQWILGTSEDKSIINFEAALGHEIGHAIGLDHPGAKGAIMGYDEYWDPALRPADIKGAQTLYGAREPSTPAPAGN